MDLRGDFGWFLQKCGWFLQKWIFDIFLGVQYNESLMCKPPKFPFIYFFKQSLWYINKQNQKLTQSCDLIKSTDPRLKQGILWWTTGKNYYFSKFPYINLLIATNAGILFVLFR